MKTQSYQPYQYLSADLLNAAQAAMLENFTDLNSYFRTPGVINSSQINYSGIGGATVTVTFTNTGNTVTGGVLFGNGTIGYGYGTTNGSVNPVYNISLSGPSGTIYIVANTSTVGESTAVISGPPPGHPDYDPTYTPTTAFTQSWGTLNIVATTTVPDNVTNVELCRVGWNGASITSITSAFQVPAGNLLPEYVTSFNGRSGVVVPEVGDYSTWYGQLAVANTWSAKQTISGSNYLYFSSTSVNFPEIILASSGVDYGYMAAIGSNQWALGYTTSLTALGTSALVWNGSGVVTTSNNTLDNGSGGASFAGTVLAALFSGSGASLTSIPWASLTGVPSLVNSFNSRTGAVVPEVWDYSTWYGQLTVANIWTQTNTFNGGPLSEYYGACGNYLTVGNNTWGGPIWGMDTSYTGGAGAANWSPSGVFGIAWQRVGSSNANSNIGEGLYVYHNGTLTGGIGTVGIYSAGTIVSAGVANFNTSSLESKEDVHELEFSMDKFMQIEPISYTHKGSQLPTDGFSAENIYANHSKLTMLKEGKPYAVNYQGLIPHTVKAAQIHETALQELKEKVAKLETIIAKAYEHGS